MKRERSFRIPSVSSGKNRIPSGATTSMKRTRLKSSQKSTSASRRKASKTMYDYNLSTQHETETDARVEMIKRVIERKRNAKVRTVSIRNARAVKYAMQGRI